MANPQALATFQPYAPGTGPDTTVKPVKLITNLAGDPIRFTLNEDLSSIVSTATLTVLNATVSELGPLGGVPGEDDSSIYGKEIEQSTVEPNVYLYVVEIVGNDDEYDYTEDGNGNRTYFAIGDGQVCQTHWRIVSASMNISEEGIPTCDIDLESLSKIAQEAKLNAQNMDNNDLHRSRDNSFIIIEGTYLDSIFYYHNLYAGEDGYAVIDSLADLLESFQNGTEVVTTTGGTPYPNSFTLQYISSHPMEDGHTYNGQTIDGIQEVQLFLRDKGYHGCDGVYVFQGTGVYAQNTYCGVREYQKKLWPNTPGNWTGKVDKNLWETYMFPSQTTSVHGEPACFMLEVREENGGYNDYCDIFFNRIIYMGYNFANVGDSEYPNYTFKSYTADHPEINLQYIPLYTVYETGGNVWEIISDIFALNGYSLRFRRDGSLAVWETSQLTVLSDEVTIGDYDVGLTLSYTKEGVINKAVVKGWIGTWGDETVTVDPVYAPTIPSQANTYPNKVNLQYPGVTGYTCNGFMRDDYACHGITGVHAVQVALINKGFSCGPQGHDGIFGPDTRAGVRAFQTAAKITVDGKVGSVTWGKLFPSTAITTMTYAQVTTELRKVRGIVVHEDYGFATVPSGTTPATVSWLDSLYPALKVSEVVNIVPGQTLLWSVFSTIINHYYDITPDITIINYWIPDSKEQKSVEAYSALADRVLNISGTSRFAVEGEFEVSPDYCLTSEQALSNYGVKEIFKTVMLARSGSYTSNNLPLYAEVGMKLTGQSPITGTTTMLIVSLNRTTDVQQQQVSTQISGNLISVVEPGDAWV